MPFNMIVAVNNNNGIGFQGKIPWKNTEDLAFFNETTQNSVLIMGRKTFESLPTNFKKGNREIVVVSSSGNLDAKNFEQALKIAKNKLKDQIFVCGGQKIYEEAYKHEELEFIYISRIDNDSECDKFFVELDNRVVKEENIQKKTFNLSICLIDNKEAH